MRTITLMGAAAAALMTAATLIATPASADRICKRDCDGGFCRTRCVERGDRMYMYDRDSYRHRHHEPGLGIRGPGFDVDVRR